MHLVPSLEGDSTALVQQFFACLAALMSTQLRSLVINSLADFVSFLSLYKVNNSHAKIIFSLYDDYSAAVNYTKTQNLMLLLDKHLK